MTFLFNEHELSVSGHLSDSFRISISALVDQHVYEYLHPDDSRPLITRKVIFAHKLEEIYLVEDDEVYTFMQLFIRDTDFYRGFKGDL